MNAVIRYQAVSDIGSVRSNNEDMACVDGRLVRDSSLSGEVDAAVCAGFALADGMGGYEGGEVASEIVCRSFSLFLKSLSATDEVAAIASIKEWAVQANRLVCETASLRPQLAEMGTTFIALIFINEKCYLLNVGDSRCYRLRSGILKLLSKDHSERERMANPLIPSNVIYNFMGIPERLFFSDVTVLTPLEGDTYILCSDGLSDYVDEEFIESHANDIDSLVAEAKDVGGRDNISIVKIQLTSKLE